MYASMSLAASPRSSATAIVRYAPIATLSGSRPAFSAASRTDRSPDAKSSVVGLRGSHPSNVVPARCSMRGPPPPNQIGGPSDRNGRGSSSGHARQHRERFAARAREQGVAHPERVEACLLGIPCRIDHDGEVALGPQQSLARRKEEADLGPLGRHRQRPASTLCLSPPRTALKVLRICPLIIGPTMAASRPRGSNPCVIRLPWPLGAIVARIAIFVPGSAVLSSSNDRPSS